MEITTVKLIEVVAFMFNSKVLGIHKMEIDKLMLELLNLIIERIVTIQTVLFPF